jgi:hypothetical protein
MVLVMVVLQCGQWQLGAQLAFPVGLAYLPWPASDAARRILGAGFASYFRNSTLYYEEPVDLAKKVPASHVVLGTSIMPRRLSVLLYARGILPNRRASGACICCAVCVCLALKCHTTCGQAKVLLCVHPHGIFCMGWGTLFCRPELKGVQFCFSPALFKSPFFRRLCFTVHCIHTYLLNEHNSGISLGVGSRPVFSKKICIVWWIMWVGEVLGTGLLLV